MRLLLFFYSSSERLAFGAALGAEALAPNRAPMVVTVSGCPPVCPNSGCMELSAGSPDSSSLIVPVT